MSSQDDHRIDDPRIDAGRVAIPGDSPAGGDAREDPEFEAIEAELRRMDADGPSIVRWGAVADNALVILRQRSKDLLVGAWLSFALYQSDSYRGLAVGLTVLRDMIDLHWEGLQPPVKRERGRVAAVEWLVGRLARPVADAEPGEAQAADVLAARDALDDIDRLLDEKLTKEQAALGELVRALRPHADAARRILEAAQEPSEPEPEPAQDEAKAAPDAQAAAAPARPAAPAPAPAAPTPAAPAISTEVDTSNLDRAATQLETAMRKLASAMRSASPADPRAYLYLRAANWFGLTELPPHQTGRTMLPPPASDRRAAIETMRQAQQHEAALLEAESVLAAAPFWLDGQRIVAQALGAMGGACEPARIAVVGMTASFVERLPQLTELRFVDDTPFCDDATRRWLDESKPAASANGTANGASSDDEGLAEAMAEARALSAAGKAREGLDRLGAALRGVSAGRERFVWQASQAEYCLENGFVGAAISLVDYLDRTVESLGLESWEPALAARSAELRYRAFRHGDAEKMVGPDRCRMALETALGRLARIDVAAAAGLPH